MVFGNQNEINGEITIKISNVCIERVFKTKFLGVMIDSRLTWKQHIYYIKGKTSKSDAILSKSGYVLNYKALRIIYNSLIVPYMS